MIPTPLLSLRPPTEPGPGRGAAEKGGLRLGPPWLTPVSSVPVLRHFWFGCDYRDFVCFCRFLGSVKCFSLLIGIELGVLFQPAFSAWKTFGTSQ